ncbi:MAG: hypothetical protein K2X27_13215 [Candidatus Obscuribacterales bacterium]|nr:hypothetical protein [Candidatus Obscuribacterales bacterium]
MSLQIGRYEFEGPLVNPRGVKDIPGVLAIMSYRNQEFEIVELAESANLRAELGDQENQEYWQSKSLGMLTFSVHYSPRLGQNRRSEIVGEILREFDGECQEFQPQRGLVASGSR